MAKLCSSPVYSSYPGSGQALGEVSSRDLANPPTRSGQPSMVFTTCRLECQNLQRITNTTRDMGLNFQEREGGRERAVEREPMLCLRQGMRYSFSSPWRGLSDIGTSRTSRSENERAAAAVDFFAALLFCLALRTVSLSMPFGIYRVRPHYPSCRCPSPVVNSTHGLQVAVFWSCVRFCVCVVKILTCPSPRQGRAQPATEDVSRKKRR